MRSPPEFAVLERAKRASHVDPAAPSYAIIRLEVTEFFGQPIRFQLINVKEYPDKKAIKRLLTNGRLRSLTKAPPGHKPYSGGWYSQLAIDYINDVKNALANKDWRCRDLGSN
jgi:hypothetical protein